MTQVVITHVSGAHHLTVRFADSAQRAGVRAVQCAFGSGDCQLAVGPERARTCHHMSRCGRQQNLDLGVYGLHGNRGFRGVIVENRVISHM